MTAAVDAAVLVRRGEFTLDVEIRVDEGETLALLGPNGSGKSTLLGAVSGVIVPDRGTVAVRGRRLSVQSHEERVWEPPEKRRVGLLGQDPLLFPHLSALDNVAFGGRAQGVRRSAARADALSWLDAVGLSGLADRKPSALSGGQQQRVAIARALAARPDVVLLDEPFAALDVETAVQIRRLLGDRLSEARTTTVLVTHDVLDAVVLADRCAILQNGRIIDDGPKERVLGTPANQFIAALTGVNLLIGRSDGGDRLILPDGRFVTGTVADRAPLAAGSAASAVFGHGAVSVHPSTAQKAAHPGARNGGWDATVVALEPAADGIRLRLADDPQLTVQVSAADAIGMGVHAGSVVSLVVDPALVRIQATAG
jgi:molybdate transport system ATP-binding protein